MEAGRAAHAIVAQSSETWRRRRIPVYIRECLMVPYFVAEEADEYALYIMQLPAHELDKVRFKRYASVSRYEAQTPSILSVVQSSSPAG